MADGPTPEERRFRALASSTQDRIAELDATGRAVYLSYDEAGLDDLECVHPDDRERVALHFLAAFRDGSCERTSYRIEEPDGRERWVESTISPFPVEGGRHVLVLSRDVTATRLTEIELRDSRARFQRIAETAYDMIVEFDTDWRVLYANQRVRDVLGFEKTTRYSAARSVHPDDRERAAQVLGSVGKGEIDFAEATYRTRHADGSWRWVDVSFRALERASGERHVLAIGRDVTARVEAESSLLESEHRYRDLVEHAPLGIYVATEGRLVYTNEAGARILGAGEPTQVIGTAVASLVPHEASEGARRHLEFDPDAMGGPEPVELEFTGLDGRPRHVRGAATPTRYQGAPAYQAILCDVTDLEQSRREQERLQLQLLEARKLESLGVLAGGIAHDFNNLLAVILSNVRYARDPKARGGERDEALGDAEEAAESAARLVRQLLAYAGRREPEVRRVEISERVGSIAELLGTAVSQGVSLQLDLAGEPLCVHVDVVQLEQVLMNLVLNAAEALRGGVGRVTVRTARTRLDESALAGWRHSEDVVAGDYACLEVEDDGAGMDESVRERIFDPFFTTKTEGHGLGLSAVLGMVQGHRGAIQVESAPWRGTRIAIALPLDEAEQPLASRRSPLVLLAESDEALRARLEERLGALGARVVPADAAASALGLCAMHGEELDAAVIEAELAAPDAPPLARALREANPALPIALRLGSAAPLPELRALAAVELPADGDDALLDERLAALLAKCEPPGAARDS